MPPELPRSATGLASHYLAVPRDATLEYLALPRDATGITSHYLAIPRDTAEITSHYLATQLGLPHIFLGLGTASPQNVAINIRPFPRIA
jgi:hypothetical protein